MVRSILELNEALRTAEQEIRKLKLGMQKVSGGGTRITQVTGVLQPENGGTGVTCDIKGAVTIWSNNSGGARTAGDVVVENGDRTFTTTTSVGNRLVIGIVEDASVANGINGCIRHTGYQAGVKVQGAVTAGDYLRTSATAGRAESAGTTPVDGAFAIALTANGGGAGTVNAFLLAGAVHQTASAGVTDHDALTGLNESEDHFAKGADLTIAAGVITATHSHHRVDTEAAAASDDLDTVSGFVANRLLLLQPVSDARTIVIKHNTGNILCVNNADLTLDDAHDFAILLYDSSLSKWMALFDSGGSLSAHDHTSAGGDGGVLTGDRHDSFSEYVEIASPSSPAANELRVFAKDVSGDTHLFQRESDGTEIDLAAGGSGTGESVNQYLFAPDAAPGADVSAGDQQGSIYHSGPADETATLLLSDSETAAGTSCTVTVQYGDTNDLDTVASWTTIATKAMAGKSDSQSSMTNATIPANRLLRFNVTSISGTAPRDVTVTLQVERPGSGAVGTYMKRVLIQEHEFHPISAISDQIGATPNQQGTYLFASAAARAVIFNWLVPADWDSGAVDFVLHYAKDAIGTGNIVHRFNTSLLDVGDDLGQTGTDSDQTVAVTADPAQTHQTITWADLFTPGAVGEVWRINYQRRGADAGDTYGGQSHVFCIEIQYTAKRIPS